MLCLCGMCVMFDVLVEVGIVLFEDVVLFGDSYDWLCMLEYWL